jgi:hypothetical protein
MTLKMHHIAPKCIMFSKKIFQVMPPDPCTFERDGEEGRRMKGKEGGSGWEGG